MSDDATIKQCNSASDKIKTIPDCLMETGKKFVNIWTQNNMHLPQGTNIA